MTGNLSMLHVRAAQLAQARGDVPEDGSGIDGVWTDEFPDYDQEQLWFVAMNADDESREYRVTEDYTTSIKPYRAHFWWNRDQVAPAAVTNPHGGEGLAAPESFDRTVEDQLIASIEAVLDDLGFADFEAVILDV